MLTCVASYFERHYLLYRHQWCRLASALREIVQLPANTISTASALREILQRPALMGDAGEEPKQRRLEGPEKPRSQSPTPPQQRPQPRLGVARSVCGGIPKDPLRLPRRSSEDNGANVNATRSRTTRSCRRRKGSNRRRGPRRNAERFPRRSAHCQLSIWPSPEVALNVQGVRARAPKCRGSRHQTQEALKSKWERHASGASSDSSWLGSSSSQSGARFA